MRGQRSSHRKRLNLRKRQVLIALCFCMMGVFFTQLLFSEWQTSDEVSRPRRSLDGVASNSSDGLRCSAPEDWEGKTYPPDLFRHWPVAAQRLMLPLYITGAFYMFLALAIVCDEFFVPALEVMIEKTAMPEEIAGATFMAAGGSAPELFASLIGMLFSHQVDVGIGTIIGSAVFNILFVIAVCSIASPTTLVLTWWPLTRDTFFYVIGLLMIIYSFYDSHIQIYESLALFGWYLCYCAFMSVSVRLEMWVNQRLSICCTPSEKVAAPNLPQATYQAQMHPNADIPNGPGQKVASGLNQREFEAALEKAAVSLSSVAAATAVENGGGGGGGHTTKISSPETNLSSANSTTVLVPGTTTQLPGAVTDENAAVVPSPSISADSAADEYTQNAVTLAWPKGAGFKRQLVYLCLLPIMLPLVLTVPDPKRGRPDRDPAAGRETCPMWGHRLYVVTFVMSIVWIAVFSYFLVWWVERAGWLTCVPTVVMGLTFLAAGTSVPDLVTSYLVSKKGYGDMALSSSIGSNLFDICVGLPIPWMLFVAISSDEQQYGMTRENWFAIPVSNDDMFCYISLLLLMLLFVFGLILALRWRFYKPLGYVMMALYVIFLSASVLIGFGALQCPF